MRNFFLFLLLTIKCSELDDQEGIPLNPSIGEIMNFSDENSDEQIQRDPHFDPEKPTEEQVILPTEDHSEEKHEKEKNENTENSEY